MNAKGIIFPKEGWLYNIYSYPTSIYISLSPDTNILKRWAVKTGAAYTVSVIKREAIEFGTIARAVIFNETHYKILKKIATEEIKPKQELYVVNDWRHEKSFIFFTEEDAYKCCNNLIEMNAKGANESTALMVVEQEVV